VVAGVGVDVVWAADEVGAASADPLVDRVVALAAGAVDRHRAVGVVPNQGGTTDLTLTDGKNYSVRWFDPRNGGSLQKGSVLTVSGPGPVSLGLPPSSSGMDWVALVRGCVTVRPGSPLGQVKLRDSDVVAVLPALRVVEESIRD
jgi:hypothetical protein